MAQITRDYQQIGEEIAGSWGLRFPTSYNNEQAEDYIRKLDKETHILCLLAALVENVRTLNVNLWRLRQDVLDSHKSVVAELQDLTQGPREVDSQAVSAGMLQCLLRATGALTLLDADQSVLSVRARGTLKRLDTVLLSDITEEKLLAIPNCGKRTATEIMAWVNQRLEIERRAAAGPVSRMIRLHDTE